MYKPVDELARALINFKPGYIFSQNYKPNELVRTHCSTLVCVLKGSTRIVYPGPSFRMRRL